MKKLLYIIIIISTVSFIFLGCDALSSTNAIATSQPNTSAAPVSNDSTTNKAITIISPTFYSGTLDTTLGNESTLYLEELFKNNGFDVKFDRVYYNTDSPTCFEEYFTYLSQNLAKDNTLAFVSGYKMDALSDYVKIANLNKQSQDSAPSYYSYAQRNPIISNSNDKAIITSTANLDNTTVLFVPNIIHNEYEKSIETTDDYFNFLKWANYRNESLRPSVLLAFHDDITTRVNILYDIFLPEHGYISLDKKLGYPSSICVDAKKPDKVYDITSLDFYDSMLSDMERKFDSYSIVLKHENTAKKNFSSYSSVIMAFGDMPYYSNASDYNFDPRNYTMEILNPHLTLESVHESSYIVAADSTIQSEAMRLIDWIYSDINNYIIVKYGEAGINYSFDDTGYITVEDAGKHYAQYSPIASMISNIEFEASIRNLTSNYLSEINTIEYVKGDNFAKQYENYITLITTDNIVYDTINRLIRRGETTVRTLEIATERKVDYTDSIFQFDDIDDLISEIAK